MTVPGTSWGRWPQYEQRLIALSDRFTQLPSAGPLLPYGNGRSYGDVCLNEGGTLLTTRGLDRFIAFDPVTGVLECEAGVLFSEIIDLVLPQGWFLPVTPGTSFVTLGGAVANDVHGKNHHRTASFGNHVLEIELQRSDGTVLICHPNDQSEWFAATVGGLGLTGLIRRVKVQLRRVPGPWLRGDSLRFQGIHDFFALASGSDADFEYSVAWIDCALSGKNLGRGIFMRANHAQANEPLLTGRPLRLPFTPPVSLVNGISLRAFNYLYFHRPAAEMRDAVWHYRPYFYPLDSIMEWNRMYGPRGFFQYQCVVPEIDAEKSITEMLKYIARSGTGSFLAVLKKFGNLPSLGMMSFARPGITLALDFPNLGSKTLILLNALDAITLTAGGAVYPAKDARMSANSFQKYFPNWQQFSQYVDPQFSSSFWRRVTGHT